MKKETEKLAQTAVALQENLSEMTVDKINDVAPVLEEQEKPINWKEKARAEGVFFVEPKRKLPALGKLQDKLKKQHAYDWEYVKAVYENPKVNEPINFWLAKYAGDPDCEWEIPCNQPVYVPRMVAQHLSGEMESLTGIQSMIYHTFDYMEAPQPFQRADRFTHQFQVIGTHSRGRMRPMGVFA